MVIADRIGTAVSTVFGDYAQFDGFQTGLAIILYALQIYLDFSGGIDIARGCSEMLGITLMENFQRPYFGNTVSEYWRRWHIALTSWMRDYVFFPLTLSKFSNKVGKWGRKHIKGSIGKQLPSYFPTFVTFFLIGVWHGAGWGFIVFGLYNATIIVVSMILTPVFQRMIKFFHINEKSFGWKVFQIARTFLIMAAGKTLTRASSVHVAVAMLKRVVGIKTAAYAGASSATAAAAETLASTGATGLPVFSAMGLDLGNWIVLFITFALFFTVSVLQERGMEMRETLAAKPFYVRWIVYLLGFAAVVILGVYGPGYSASEFVYRNF
ncbi:MBOAT family O-acyltransferase [Mobilibacterium timonense]|nr:MBOAT family O-acyltransferase [Mobilibacterium timonense]